MQEGLAREGAARSAYAAGWYPDPAGAHDHRYHNGTEWTADVSTDGVRSVHPLPPPPGDPSGSGTAPLILGILSLTFGWVPFVAFVMLVVAVVAVALGIRRRHGSGSAVAGIVTGTVGMLFSLGGIWLSVAILGAISEFERPGAHDAQIIDCDVVDGVTRASGTITNLEADERSYTITVTFDGDARASTTVSDVAPGAEVAFSVDEDLRFADLNCQIDEVNGPRPFGFGLEGDN